MFTRLSKRKLDEGDFEGFKTDGEKIREDLEDKTGGILAVEKLLAVIGETC